MKGFLVIAFTLSCLQFESSWDEVEILQKFLVEAKHCDFDKSKEIVVLQNELIKQNHLKINGYDFVFQNKETMFFNRTDEYWKIQVIKNTDRELKILWQFKSNQTEKKCKQVFVEVTK